MRRRFNAVTYDHQESLTHTPQISRKEKRVRLFPTGLHDGQNVGRPGFLGNYCLTIRLASVKELLVLLDLRRHLVLEVGLFF